MELNRQDGRKDRKQCTNDDRRDYDRALKASHKEAAATMAVALVTVLYFWGAVFFFEDSEVTLFSLPLWFVASCIGGYVLSIAGVLFLVNGVFTDIDLDRAAEGFHKEDDAR